MSRESDAGGESTFGRARKTAEELLRGKRERSSDSGARRGAGKKVFETGQVVAGRYRVERFLSRGGVGQVYEVEDRELGGRVALKTLHPDLASSPSAVEQFKREIALARTVTDEHVCRLFDFGREASDDGRYFVTMELLDGETLGERIRRDGAFDVPAALGYAREILQGIRAAHRRQVIHRDIKASNVFLANRPDGTTRAVVTDFGLAVSAPDGDGESGPSPSRLEGTPLFMAPEQVRGDAITEATDLYGFGILLYYMLTGHWPFVGTSPVSTALARIERDPAPLSRHLPDLDPRVEALVMHCIERDPADRPGSAEALLETIDGILDPRPAASRPARASWFPWAAGLALVAALAAGGLWLGLRNHPDHGVAAGIKPILQAGLRPSVVTLGMANGTGDPAQDWIATHLANGIHASLTAGEQVLTVDPERVASIKTDLAITDIHALKPAQINQLGRISGAGWMLAGTVRRSGEVAGGNGLIADLRLTSTNDPRTRHELSVSSETDNPWELVAKAGRLLRDRLEVPEITGDQDGQARAEQPTDPEAARLFAEGVAAYQSSDYARAQQLLEQSLEIEPGQPMTHFMLYKVWSGKGYSARSREQATRAFENSKGLSRETQLRIEAVFRMATHDWERAEELSRALWEFFPDNLGYGLLLVQSQDRSRRLDEALGTIDSIRALGPPLGTDPRLDLAEAMVAYHSGDYPRGFRAAVSATENGRELGSRWMIAGGLERQALTWGGNADPQQPLSEILDEAHELYSQLGDMNGQVTILSLMGKEAQTRGDLRGAEEHYREVVGFARKIGNDARLARAETSLGIVLEQQGKLDEGVALKESVLANYRRRNIRQGVAITLENLGISFLKLGRLRQARAHFEEAAEQFEDVGDKIGIAWAPYHLSRVWIEYGELDVARTHAEKAIEAAKTRPEGGLEHNARFELMRVEFAGGNLDAARTIAEELIRKYEEIELPVEQGESRLMLGRIAARQGRFEEARDQLRQAEQTFEELGVPHWRALAQAEMARLHMGRSEGVDDEIRQACDGLASQMDGFQHLTVLLQGRIVLQQCAWRADGASPALEAELKRIEEQAEEHGLFEAQLEATQLRASLIAESGDTPRANTIRAVYRREAEERGWALIER
ncbi:hypothetical protein ABI59_23355 [Acidobacteria bacterium Mor1]|nr:hypothetical protein ABI59_23355 [Acidobacteria bacterium Mor1]